MLNEYEQGSVFGKKAEIISRLQELDLVPALMMRGLLNKEKGFCSNGITTNLFWEMIANEDLYTRTRPKRIFLRMNPCYKLFVHGQEKSIDEVNYGAGTSDQVSDNNLYHDKF